MLVKNINSTTVITVTGSTAILGIMLLIDKAWGQDSITIEQVAGFTAAAVGLFLVIFNVYASMKIMKIEIILKSVQENLQQIPTTSDDMISITKFMNLESELRAGDQVDVFASSLDHDIASMTETVAEQAKNEVHYRYLLIGNREDLTQKRAIYSKLIGQPKSVKCKTLELSFSKLIRSTTTIHRRSESAPAAYSIIENEHLSKKCFKLDNYASGVASTAFEHAWNDI